MKEIVYSLPFEDETWKLKLQYKLSELFMDLSESNLLGL